MSPLLGISYLLTLILPTTSEEIYNVFNFIRCLILSFQVDLFNEADRMGK